MLTRLRQLVLHPGLLPASYLDDLTAKEAANVGDPVQLAKPPNREETLKLQQVLLRAVEDSEECPICFEVLQDDAKITSCSHTFCATW
jgi:SWI/SNF-related matrix-associated actin-dependent regulator of chromatin subfamily A3